MPTRLTTIALLATIAITAACSGGGSKTATPTASDFSRTAAYFSGLSQSLQAAETKLDATEAPDATVAPASVTVPGPAALVPAIETLEQLATSLEALAPPPAASTAHLELVGATRALIALGHDATTQTPVNDATAEARAIPAIARFHKACLDLAIVAQDSDAPVDLPCGEDNPPPAADTPVSEGTPEP